AEREPHRGILPRRLRGPQHHGPAWVAAQTWRDGDTPRSRAQRDGPRSARSAQRPQAARREPDDAAAHRHRRPLVHVEQVDAVARGGRWPEEVRGRADHDEVIARARHHSIRVAAVDRQAISAVGAEVMVEALPAAAEPDTPVARPLLREGSWAATLLLGSS